MQEGPWGHRHGLRRIHGAACPVVGATGKGGTKLAHGWVSSRALLGEGCSVGLGEESLSWPAGQFQNGTSSTNPAESRCVGGGGGAGGGRQSRYWLAERCRRGLDPLRISP